MGGHYPFTPETTALIIEECAKRKAYVAFHAGSTANGSNIKGYEEALQLAAGNPCTCATSTPTAVARWKTRCWKRNACCAAWKTTADRV